MIEPSKIDLDKVVRIVSDACEAVLNIYNRDISVHYKNDNSPLTAADLASHDLICKNLNKIYPDIPIISEESEDNFVLNIKDDCFWCVDPLDGTKEFVKKNDEFTINLALIKNEKSILGVVGVPAKNTIYFAAQNKGAYKLQLTSDNQKKITHIKTKNISKKVRFVASKSHLDEDTKAFIGKENNEISFVGSSLKILLLAEGKFDVYPRFAPTMIWDTAASHIILKEAGGTIMNLNNCEIIYNKNNLQNESFIAASNSFFNLKNKLDYL